MHTELETIQVVPIIGYITCLSMENSKAVQINLINIIFYFY